MLELAYIVFGFGVKVAIYTCMCVCTIKFVTISELLLQIIVTDIFTAINSHSAGCNSGDPM